jgi:hypothetical protein
MWLDHQSQYLQLIRKEYHDVLTRLVLPSVMSALHRNTLLGNRSARLAKTALEERLTVIMHVDLQVFQLVQPLVMSLIALIFTLVVIIRTVTAHG